MLKSAILALAFLSYFHGICQKKEYMPEIIAHRGASYNAPENTRASVILGYKEGADAVEIDVQLSKDNRLIVMHDKNTSRTTGANLEIKDSESVALRKLDAGSWKDTKFAGEKIPFLEEILPLIPKGKKLVIELKTGPEIVSHLKKAVENHKKENLIIISFDRKTISSAKKSLPDIPAYWLLGNYNSYTLDQAIQFALDNQLNGLDVHYALVTDELVEKTARVNLEIYAYTVNDPGIAQKLRSHGIKGITTDKPEWLREHLEQPLSK